MDAVKLGWLAGLLEGEGSFLKGPPSAPNTPRITIQMTDRDVIERVAHLFEVNFVVEQEGQEHHHKRSFSTALKGGRAVELMIALYPLMGARRQGQIQEAVWSYPPENRRLASDHGKLYGKGCRCDLCRTGHKEQMRAYRARNRIDEGMNRL